MQGVPEPERSTKIAFITRTKGVCHNRGSCKYGCLLLNVLEVNLFAPKIKYTLHTSLHECCMEFGMSDDYLQKCFTKTYTSSRGLDVTLIAQYRNRLILDCVTNITQHPIRFPMPKDDDEMQ